MNLRRFFIMTAAALTVFAACDVPTYEGSDKPEGLDSLISEKMALDTSWSINYPSASYDSDTGLFMVSGLGNIAPDEASYAEGITLREVTAAADYNTVYTPGAAIGLTFKYFNAGSGTAYFAPAAALEQATKRYEVYINAAKLTRQGGVKLNGDDDNTPGEEEDGAYCYFGASVTGQERWTNSLISMYLQPVPIGSGTEYRLTVSNIGSDDPTDYTALLNGKLKAYKISGDGSKTDAGAVTLTYIQPTSTPFTSKVYTVAPVTLEDGFALLQFEVTDCNSIKTNGTVYGFKNKYYTLSDKANTKVLASLPLARNGLVSADDAYSAYASSGGGAETTKTIQLMPITYVPAEWTTLSADSVKVFRITTQGSSYAFSVLEPKVLAVTDSTSSPAGKVDRHIITVEKPANDSALYYIAIKPGTEAKTNEYDSGSDTYIVKKNGYFGIQSPQTTLNSAKVPLEYQYWTTVQVY